MILKKPVQKGGLTWSLFKGGSKYNARKTEYNGVLYHSTLEARYAQYLDTLLRAKKILSWDRQIRIPLIVNGVKVCVYVMDFVYTKPNKEVVWVEVKGAETQTWKLKWKILKALYPDRTLELVRREDLAHV